MSNNPGRKNPLLQAERADRNRKILIQVAVAAVLIGLVAAIGIGIAIKKAERDDPGPTPSIAAAQAPGAVSGSITDNGSIRVGKPEAKVTVRVVADLQCPACKSFEAAYGQLLEDAVASGTAAVEYNIISFLDKASTTEYSTRAANASYCVAQQDPTKYQAWLKAMFAQQPPEGGSGLTDQQLIEIAKSVGYTDDVASCITDRTYDKYVASTTNQAFDSGIQSTPTVFVDGKQVNPSALEQAIATAAAGQ
ncbi:thioredoxin domain-containing protein [Nocardia amikacinitolerans]|uniref:thioredoxin domain-containing protein n=1 Tax=Nocardia amikacinitolerans TaxID=756689 RepID=UPI0020A3D4FD|nr:thioredoxin domain-containing protein [Nocardia amikacinitolerans]MCP2290305.1 Protein-disulfide isomerase [Nocardia amikacinitolerans]